MDASEDEAQHEVCVECGADVSLVGERAVAVADEVLICPQCAERRGGVYDEQTDEWAPAPDVADLTARYAD